MANKEQEVEKIAQEEVYPARYFGRKFPGEWASERHHAICLNIAEDTYLLREAQKRREENQRRKEEKKNREVAERDSVDGGGDE